MSTPSVSPASLVVTVGVQCHVGKQRTENQDRVTRASTPFGELFVVADGMGGYEGGAEAAQATVDGLVGYLNANSTLSLSEAIQQAARNIGAELQQRAEANPALHGMGSTVVLCVVQGTRVTYAHAGDSRLYLIRDGQMQQLTRDHSVMERLVAQGTLTAAQAREHPDASVLTRAIGQGADVSLDLGEVTLQPRDALLLCSDGLWGYAQPAEMEAVAVSENLSPSAVAAALLELALEGGGGDNISIQYLRFEPTVTRTPNARLFGLPRAAAVAVIAIAIVLAIVAIGGAIRVLNSGKVDQQQQSGAPPAAPSNQRPAAGQSTSGTQAPASEKPATKPAMSGRSEPASTTARPKATPASKSQPSQQQPSQQPQPPADDHSPLNRAHQAVDKVTDAVKGVPGEVTGAAKNAEKSVEQKVHSRQPSSETPHQSDSPPSQNPPPDSEPH